jgi:hypothetical protein
MSVLVLCPREGRAQAGPRPQPRSRLCAVSPYAVVATRAASCVVRAWRGKCRDGESRTPDLLVPNQTAWPLAYIPGAHRHPNGADAGVAVSGEKKWCCWRPPAGSGQTLVSGAVQPVETDVVTAWQVGRTRQLDLRGGMAPAARLAHYETPVPGFYGVAFMLPAILAGRSLPLRPASSPAALGYVARLHRGVRRQLDLCAIPCFG